MKPWLCSKVFWQSGWLSIFGPNKVTQTSYTKNGNSGLLCNTLYQRLLRWDGRPTFRFLNTKSMHCVVIWAARLDSNPILLRVGVSTSRIYASSRRICLTVFPVSASDAFEGTCRTWPWQASEHLALVALIPYVPSDASRPRGKFIPGIGVPLSNYLLLVIIIRFTSNKSYGPFNLCDVYLVSWCYII